MTGKYAVVQPRLASFGLRASALEFFAGLEHIENVSNRFRVITSLHHVFHAEAVRFHFILAAITLHPRFGTDIGELPDSVRAGENRRRHGAE